ncbi:WXG100 family type VII secretion target [Paenibacillus sp. BIHB 4019]|uniref:ESAT-6-like protein n=1 Tax=Paenibacillus sp. BIHB 4019 TaxID=1870819 RepID=A0A1B2DDC9_9BACL|nr:WXG100 family type VII secretion target [Paenibacillus sp. BIHB 4019]ANY65705.1 hypothetical protein BBD42_03925 [Paenibacillus sp. BIHB 4019]
MAEVRLSYDGLKGQGQKVHGQKEQFDALLASVMGTINQLESVWSDKAAKDFMDQVRGMEPTFKKFGEALEGLSKHMINVSNKYEELSNNVISSQKF